MTLFELINISELPDDWNAKPNFGKSTVDPTSWETSIFVLYFSIESICLVGNKLFTDQP